MKRPPIDVILQNIKKKLKCSHECRNDTDSLPCAAAVKELQDLTGLQCNDKLFVRWVITRDSSEQESDVNNNTRSNSSDETCETSNQMLMNETNEATDEKFKNSSDASFESRSVETDTEQYDDIQSVTWWPTTIDNVSKLVEPIDGQIYQWTIVYENVDDFPSENRTVVFVEKRKLWDIAQHEYIRFCIKGELEEEQCKENDQIVTLAELVEAQNQIDRIEGDDEIGSADELLVQLLETLPVPKRFVLASGFRHLSDDLHDFLKEKVDKCGSENFVFTTEMVKEFVTTLRRPVELDPSSYDCQL